MDIKFLKKVFTMDFVKELQDHGGEVFIVGGCVRDAITGKKPKDIDIVVRCIPSANLEAILLDFGKVDLVGESFGVFKFKCRQDEQEYDIALPRSDIKIEGERGHKAIESVTDFMMPIEKDLGRRDFTINSIAMDRDGNLIDPFCGQEDLMKRIIHPTSEDAFIEDPLRMLRALQFAARFNFTLSDELFSLLKTHRELIREITPERVLIEFEKVFDKKGNPELFAMLLKTTGLFKCFFGIEILIEPHLSIRTLHQFLNRAIGFSVENTADFFVRKLKIDNELKKKLQAMDILSNGKLNFDTVFRAIGKHQCVLEEDVFPIFNNLKLPFINGFFPKNINELDIKGEDMMEMGLIGKQISDAQKTILRAIFEEKIENNKESIIKFLNEWKNF